MHDAFMQYSRPYLIIILFVITWSVEATAEPRFGVEGSIGQSIGTTSYIDNTVVMRSDIPYLGNELPDAGLAIALTFLFRELEVGADLRWFPRERVDLHHRGDTTLPANRERPDGSIDDSGVTYTPIENITEDVSNLGQGDLFLASIVGGYRWYFLHGDIFEMYAPFSGGIVAAHISEPVMDYTFGLQASTGVGATLKIAGPVAITGGWRLHGLLTPTYGRQDDASRRSTEIGESTIGAMTSTIKPKTMRIGGESRGL